MAMRNEKWGWEWRNGEDLGGTGIRIGKEKWVCEWVWERGKRGKKMWLGAWRLRLGAGSFGLRLWAWGLGLGT